MSEQHPDRMEAGHDSTDENVTAEAERTEGHDAESPLAKGTHDVPTTGLDAVDRVLAKAASVDDLPVHERAAAHRELHAELEAILNQQPGSLPSGLMGQ